MITLPSVASTKNTRPSLPYTLSGWTVPKLPLSGLTVPITSPDVARITLSALSTIRFSFKYMDAVSASPMASMTEPYSCVRLVSISLRIAPKVKSMSLKSSVSNDDRPFTSVDCTNTLEKQTLVCRTDRPLL